MKIGFNLFHSSEPKSRGAKSYGFFCTLFPHTPLIFVTVSLDVKADDVPGLIVRRSGYGQTGFLGEQPTELSAYWESSV